MSVSRSGDGWTVEIDDNVIVFEFLPGMELSAFQTEAYPVYEELTTTHDVEGMVTVVELEDAFDADVFEIWEQSAQKAVASGIDRWAVVADGIKAVSLRGKIDTAGLDTLTTESKSEAIEWARGR